VRVFGSCGSFGSRRSISAKIKLPSTCAFSSSFVLRHAGPRVRRAAPLSARARRAPAGSARSRSRASMRFAFSSIDAFRVLEHRCISRSRASMRFAFSSVDAFASTFERRISCSSIASALASNQHCHAADTERTANVSAASGIVVAGFRTAVLVRLHGFPRGDDTHRAT
jgi:hypothetical protein